MTEDEFRNLWQPACNHLFNSRIGEHNHTVYEAMDKLLGVKEFETYTHTIYANDLPMSPELRRKVALLAGPHWRTVLKANNISLQKVRQCLKERKYPIAMK